MAVARPIVVLAPSGVRGAYIFDLIHHPPNVGLLLICLSRVSGERLVVAQSGVRGARFRHLGDLCSGGFRHLGELLIVGMCADY